MDDIEQMSLQEIEGHIQRLNAVVARSLEDLERLRTARGKLLTQYFFTKIVAVPTWPQ